MKKSNKKQVSIINKYQLAIQYIFIRFFNLNLNLLTLGLSQKLNTLIGRSLD